jgi:WD40 repeat protein
VCALTGTADGRLASGGEDAQVRISSLVGLSSVAAGHHSDFVRGLALLRDGRLASCSYDGTLRIWEVRC